MWEGRYGFYPDNTDTSEKTAWTALLCFVPASFWSDFFQKERLTFLIALVVSWVSIFSGGLTQQLWEHLAGLTFEVSAWLLTFVYPLQDIFQDGAKRVLDINDFRVSVAHGPCNWLSGAVPERISA